MHVCAELRCLLGFLVGLLHHPRKVSRPLLALVVRFSQAGNCHLLHPVSTNPRLVEDVLHSGYRWLEAEFPGVGKSSRLCFTTALLVLVGDPVDKLSGDGMVVVSYVIAPSLTSTCRADWNSVSTIVRA